MALNCRRHIFANPVGKNKRYAVDQLESVVMPYVSRGPFLVFAIVLTGFIPATPIFSSTLKMLFPTSIDRMQNGHQQIILLSLW